MTKIKKGALKMKHILLMLCFVLLAISDSFAQFANISITTNTLDQSEPTIAVSPLNSNNILSAWNDFRVGFSKPGYAFSTNNGANWTEKILTPPVNYTNGFDPSIAYDRYNNIFYCYN